MYLVLFVTMYLVSIGHMANMEISLVKHFQNKLKANIERTISNSMYVLHKTNSISSHSTRLKETLKSINNRICW